MDPNDSQLKQQLARDPLTRNGFDDRLRRRIEERIQSERRGSRRPLKITWRMPAAAMASVALLLFGLWYWHPGSGRNTDRDSAHTPIAMSVSETPVPNRQPQPYALLIGLRTDRPNADSFSTSTYRTVLVARQEDQPKLMANNDGLYLPHKQNFWQIATVSADGGRQALQAIQVTNRKSKRQDPTVSIPDGLLSERVLFAGNQFVSISATSRIAKDRKMEYRWVKRLDQINGKSPEPSAEPHVQIQDVLKPGGDVAAAAHQWSVVRKPGQWVARLGDGSSDANAQILDILPDLVVNRDMMLLSWQDIRGIDDAAEDAFTYGDLLGVVANHEIRVRTVRDGGVKNDPLRIPLSAGESIVMIQWAEGANYVDRWISDMRMIHDRSSS